MKRNFLSLVLWILQLCFLLVVPLIIIWLQQNESVKAELSTKVPITMIVLVLFVFVVFKKIMLNPLVKKLDSKMATMEGLALVTTEKSAIKSLKREYRGCLLFQLIINMIIPTLILIIAIITIKAVEKGLIKLYGALCLCSVSFAIGVVIRIIAIFVGKLEHENKGGK